MPLPDFADEVNPTDDEIRRWAYRDAPEPMQDWDLILADADHASTLIELISDVLCPTRSYFLGALYVLVGDAVRSQYQTSGKDEIERLLALSESTEDRWLRTWAARSRELRRRPTSFTYDAWCDGGLARTPTG